MTQDEGRQTLWVRQVATTGNVQVVPPAPHGYLGLTFSRDGDYIYYAVLERQDFPVLYRVPALGGPPRKLVEEAVGPVTFSPDGRRMAFVRGNHTLMVADADGGGVRALASRQGGESWQLPSWSPDGEKIACGVYSHDGNVWRPVEVSVKDGTERTLTAEKWQSVWGLAWLPGGKTDQVFQFDWSRDGKRLALAWVQHGGPTEPDAVPASADAETLAKALGLKNV